MGDKLEESREVVSHNEEIRRTKKNREQLKTASLYGLLTCSCFKLFDFGTLRLFIGAYLTL